MNGFTRCVALTLGIGMMLGTAGCATTGSNLAAIPRLEQERSANPSSAPVLRALGIAYYENSRYPDARTALQEAKRLDPGDGVTALYLGLTAEAQNDVPAARAAYSSYEQVGRTKKVRSELQARLALLDKKQLQLDAADAIKREAQLDATPGLPTTVAVLPFKFTGADTTLRPLERGFAELLTTDLSRSPSLTVLERARLQAILDEIALQKSGATDAATDVRAGHLIQAGRLVTGSIVQQGNQLNTTAEVLVTQTSAVQGAPSDNETVDRLFDIEKTIALDLFQTLGVTLTTAQRNAIEQRPTKSLAAFLSYSRGLEADDEGRYDDANRYFQDATRLDPGFAAAMQKSREAKVVVTATQTTSAVVEASLKGSSEGVVVVAATQGNAATAQDNGAAATTANALNPSPTQAASQSGGTTTATPTSTAQTNSPGAAAGTGADNPTTHTATVVIVIPNPTTSTAVVPRPPLP